MTNTVKNLMDIVYKEVEKAILSGNSPFAAVITDSSYNMIASAHNQANSECCAIAHAEIEAIQKACHALGTKYLRGCKIFVNAESCAMCSTAIIKSGIEEVYFGCTHEEGSNPDLYLLEVNERAVPKLKITGGIMSEMFWKQVHRGRSQKMAIEAEQ